MVNWLKQILKMRSNKFINSKTCIIVASIALITIVCILFSMKNKKEDFETLKLEEISNIKLSADSNQVLVDDAQKLERILFIINNKMNITSYESIDDTPTKFKGKLIRIEINKNLGKDEHENIFYAYKEGNAYYIEKPYYAIWTVESLDYDYFVNLLTNP